MDEHLEEQVVEETNYVEQPEQEVVEQQEQVQTVARQETLQAKNFRELREKAESIQRERDEAVRRLQDYENKVNNELQESDEDLNLAPDDLAEGKHLSKVGRKIKRLEDQLKQYQQSTHESVTETRLKNQYPDFDSIVNRETIDALRNSHPEIAATLNSNGDLYSKAVSAYTIIKKLGLVQDDSFNKDKEIAQRNAAKPKPLASVSPQQGDSPLQRANAFANGLTDDLKSQLLREMTQSRKNF